MKKKEGGENQTKPPHVEKVHLEEWYAAWSRGGVKIYPPESKRNFLKLRGVSGTALWSWANEESLVHTSAKQIVATTSQYGLLFELGNYY